MVGQIQKHFNRKDMLKMKKSHIITLSIIGTIVAITLFIFAPYNGLVGKDEAVKQAQSKIEISLQRRSDLIPNVVAVTEKYMSHEKEIFTEIANARAKIGSGVKDEKAEGETELTSAISRLLVLTENYPQLKADSQATALIAELEGTENRMFAARDDYNKVATDYNKSIRRFPTNISASIFGFQRAELIEADKEAHKAPKVEFNH